jgi:hypothetical protein
MDDFSDRQRRRARPQDGTSRLNGPNGGNGTGPLNRRQLPRQGAGGNGETGPSAQERPFVVRLDPQGKPGEFNFVIDGPEALNGRVPQAGLIAEASGGIPPQLFKAVDEVLGFIYGLDQQFESRGRRPRK